MPATPTLGLFTRPGMIFGQSSIFGMLQQSDGTMLGPFGVWHFPILSYFYSARPP